MHGQGRPPYTFVLDVKGNLGWFAWIRPNAVRSLKTDAAERLIPLHSALTEALRGLPGDGRLFPSLTVNMVTKRFSALREGLRITRPGVVFHSTRKWFVTQCERAGVEAWAEDPVNIAALYNALMARDLPEDFSAKTLNVERHGTEIMLQVFGNGRATILDQLKELLDNKGQHAVPEADVVKLVTEQLRANINTTKHLMSDLGWMKREVKWGGVDYGRQVWVRPGYTVQRGKIFGPDGFAETLSKHFDEPDIEII